MTHLPGCNPCRWLRAVLVRRRLAMGAGTLSAAEVLMKDGRLLRGKLGKIAGLADMNFLHAPTSRAS